MAGKKIAPRRIGSYENACAVLNANIRTLQPDPDLPDKQIVQFGDDSDWQEQLRRAAAHSLPPPLRLKAFPLPGGLPGRLEVIGEFAAELLLARIGRRLRLAQPGQRPLFSERANLRWICWGDLIVAAHGNLAIAQFGLGPWPGATDQLEAGSHDFNGITTDVLRAIHPERLIRTVVTQFETIDAGRKYLSDRLQHDPSRADVWQRARNPRRDGRAYPDQHYRDIASLYLSLLAQGHRRRVTTELARQLGVPTATARNWIHRARQLDYLTLSRQGQPGARPGSRLTRSAEESSRP